MHGHFAESCATYVGAEWKIVSWLALSSVSSNSCLRQLIKCWSRHEPRFLSYNNGVGRPTVASQPGEHVGEDIVVLLLYVPPYQTSSLLSEVLIINYEVSVIMT